MNLQQKPKFLATGKRKCAIARVYLYPQGQGNIQVNDAKFQDYFPRLRSQIIFKQPLILTKTENTFDIYVNIQGGGKSAQAEAARHGISRALIKFNLSLRKPLKTAGYLTRDSRIVERKKAGMSGARKRYQYSKR